MNISGKEFFFDASHPMLGFGKLLPDCYKCHARIVNEEATALNLSADSLLEKKTTILFINNDKKGNWIGKFEQIPGYYESYEIREKIRNQNGTELLDEEKEAFGIDVIIDSVS